MLVQTWAEITTIALQNLWQGFIAFVPELFGAIIIFILGWFFALGIGKLIAEILARLRFNKIFEKASWQSVLEKAEIKVNPSDFVGTICKWILVIVFLLVSVEILGFVQFAAFLKSVVAWLPNLLVAVAIFVVAVILADIFEKIVRATVKKIELSYGEFLGVAVRWAIYIFAALAILLQLGVTPTLINTLIIGFVGTISLALGLSFGLGGKDVAAEILQELRKRLRG